MTFKEKLMAFPPSFTGDDARRFAGSFFRLAASRWFEDSATLKGENVGVLQFTYFNATKPLVLESGIVELEIPQ
jgi:hypothetical protein